MAQDEARVPREKGDIRWRDLKKALRRLCRNGMKSWWIRETAEELLELACVKQEAEKDSRPKALPHALVRVVRDAIRDFEDHPYGKVCLIVLAVEKEPYVGLDGRSYDLRTMKLSDRRDLAGKEFRDGEDTVNGATIRQHHESKAFDKLTAALLKREAALTGRYHPDGRIDPPPLLEDLKPGRQGDQASSGNSDLPSDSRDRLDSPS